MTKPSNHEILSWVEAAESTYELPELPTHISNAVRAAESADRALLVDTAIRTALYEKKEGLQDELAVVESGLLGLLQERKRILTEHGQVNSALGLFDKPKTSLNEKKEILPSPISEEKIKPFTLITKGIKPHHQIYKKPQGGEVEYVEFKTMVKGYEGGYIKPIALSYLIDFLLIKEPISRHELYKPGLKKGNIDEIVRFSEEGISFLSEDPEAYLQLPQHVFKMGPAVAEGLARFLQNYTNRPSHT